MKSNLVKILLLFLGIALFLNSCANLQTYQRPQGVVNKALFRTDALPQDSISLADFSYSDIFQDSLLNQLIAKGLENNLDIRQALLNIQVSEAYLKQAKTAYFPTVEVGPGVNFQTPSLNSITGQNLDERTTLWQYDITASTSWEADIWGKYKSSEKAQQALFLQTNAVHQAVKTQIVAGIASAYFQLLALDEQKRITEETIALREKNVETTQALKEAGNLTEVAVKQTEAQLINFRASLINIENSIKILENRISYLMGETSQAIPRSDISSQKIPEEIKLGVPASLLRNRPDVMAAEYRLIHAFENVNFAQASLYPSLTIGGNFGLQSLSIENLVSGNSLFASLVGGLTQPLFQQRRLKTQEEVAQLGQQEALFNFQQSILMAGNEVSDAIQIYQSQDEFISLKEQEYESYRLATQYSEELLNYGMANYLEVLTAQQNALNAQLAAINAQYAKLNALVELYRALGGGWR